MGIATFLVAFVPTYASIGIWGAVLLTVLRFVQGVGVGGEWGGSVLLARWSGPRPTTTAASSRPGRSSACRPGCSWPICAVLAVSQMSGDGVPRLGLAHSLPAERDPGRRRPLDPASACSRRRSSAACREEQDRAGADARGDPQAARKPILLSALARMGRAGAVLHLHRLHLRLWHQARWACRATCW